MAPEDVIELAEGGVLEPSEGIEPGTAKLHRQFFSVSGLVVVPIESVGSFLDRTDDVELRDASDVPVGTVCFTRNLIQVTPASLTKWQYAAYLAECTRSRVGLLYNFERDYVVVDENFADDYIERYTIGSPIWGGFTHQPIPSREAAPKVAFIQGNPEISLPTAHHIQALNRYVEATNAFDRYLKLYHTLELLFDYVVMKRMNQVGDDLEQFGKIISDYDRSELERLRYLIREYCSNPGLIAAGFADVVPYKSRASELFQNHSKTGNPFNTLAKWEDFLRLVADGKLGEGDLRKANFVHRDLTYAAFVANVTGYWIYRVRSSIAHSRVGEFLFLEADEKFITDFAEPLLLDVVMQVFENTELKAMASA